VLSSKGTGPCRIREADTPLYDLYFLRRFIEEMVLAHTTGDDRERAVHLRACHYYGDLLGMNDAGGDEAHAWEARGLRRQVERSASESGKI
jgi:hypothetical protein